MNTSNRKFKDIDEDIQIFPPVIQKILEHTPQGEPSI
jgi:hypothetical protein